VPETRSSLVTGGAGCIGSHGVERLLAAGDHVTVVDDLSTGRRSNLTEAHRVGAGRLECIEARVSEAASVLTGRAFDEVYHLAAAVGVRRVLDEPLASLENNVIETGAALRIASASGAAFLQASSSEVYGKSTRLPFREQDDMVFGPTSVTRWSYGCSKAIDEYMALANMRQSGMRVVVARIFNTVGPRQVGRWGMVLPRFLEAAMSGRPLEVHGDGRQSRCFADVRDVSRGLVSLLGCPGAHGGVFNIGSDRSTSIRALAEMVLSVSGSAAGLVLVPYERAFPAGFEDLPMRQPDLSRIREVIGFDAGIPLDRTIADLMQEMVSGRREGRAA